jgi:hypothetical protein
MMVRPFDLLVRCVECGCVGAFKVIPEFEPDQKPTAESFLGLYWKWECASCGNTAKCERNLFSGVGR